VQKRWSKRIISIRGKKKKKRNRKARKTEGGSNVQLLRNNEKISGQNKKELKVARNCGDD